MCDTLVLSFTISDSSKRHLKKCVRRKALSWLFSLDITPLTLLGMCWREALFFSEQLAQYDLRSWYVPYVLSLSPWGIIATVHASA